MGSVCHMKILLIIILFKSLGKESDTNSFEG